ncbi:MAG: pyridoxal phosphate-dependent aminotransferase, partial [Planctomycetes bacterium]|nr:pyridoxal phosphate-dependent aminotransferase [Planctomycetota bacterium]
MKVSQRAAAVPPSATIAVTSRAKEMKAKGLDVLGFAAGEPDFDTPDFIKEAAIEALKKGQTKYTPAAGIPELRKAIAEKLKRENGLDYSFEQIVVNIGAKHSVYMTMQTLVDPGDEVLLPTPYWVTYPETIKLAGGKAVLLETSAQTGYKITPGQLKAAIADKTVLLVLNSPNNPGGFCYSPDELRALAKVLEGTKVMVLSDEIYERLVYAGTQFLSFAAISQDAYHRTMTINGLSKSFAMTGW